LLLLLLVVLDGVVVLFFGHDGEVYVCCARAVQYSAV
jgi:hypothetical protein